MVTAFVANIMKKQPGLNVYEIKNILKEYCIKQRDNKSNTINYLKNNDVDVPIILIYDCTGNKFLKIIKSLAELFGKDGYNSVSAVVFDDYNRSRDILLLQNYAENFTSLNSDIIKLLFNIHNPDIIIIGINTIKIDASLQKIYYEIESDIKIVISDTERGENRYLPTNYDELVSISDNCFCIDNINYFGIDDNMEVLYKYIIHLLEA